jgi:hypothetical protein
MGHTQIGVHLFRWTPISATPHSQERSRPSAYYLLDKTGTDTWRAVDHIALDCFHDTPAYRLLSLSPGEDFIFVHYAHLGHGSGDVEDKATVYTIRNSRMHEVLSTVDYHSRQEPTYTYPIEQNSSFLQISSHVIEETRIT